MSGMHGVAKKSTDAALPHSKEFEMSIFYAVCCDIFCFFIEMYEVMKN
jgi:hypothetical protein